MCTALTFRTRDHYFGRSLDLEYSYDEQVCVIPRAFPLPFRCAAPLERHYAMIGMAWVREGYPLWYDAVNERGLAMAGLNFPGYAAYYPYHPGPDNITPFELIPWVLGRCAGLDEARETLARVNLLDQDFSSDLPLTPMHWLVADRTGAIAVEPMSGGLRVLEDPAGVLTNAPPLDWQLTNLRQYLSLTARPPENRFSPALELTPFSRGMGGLGLPGDLSSPSRFVRAAFTRANSRSGPGEEESVSQVFHILGSVEQQRGCAVLPDGSCEVTQYAACMNTSRGIYYYTTYDNRRINAVDLHREDLDGRELVGYPLRKGQDIFWQNTTPQRPPCGGAGAAAGGD